MHRENADERSILVVAGNAEICGYERATGRLLWKHELTTKILGMTAKLGGAVDLEIRAGRVYVTSRQAILCLDYRTGTKIGEVKLASSSLRPTLLVDGDHLYVASSTTIECFTMNGERVWGVQRDGMFGSDGFALGFPGNIRQGDERGDG
ncbi:PQQ-binding-like beta-propeller repeat protein [Sandaracinus amylolyticus]|uniref:Pyrrolo-quinoline quinone repeat domain-containing protein n=1 Tax=Sandaracinus amylolyticus TaxID=927083 RepID=A0A0F6SGN6_9BACT|nr:PQQ-binding-like beta-propeller repeat protein [Sandaracinus amylolyticus]AKF09009.1 hypothetical protein DB32_006158 [Sandaracinus amylolyticus]